MTTTTQRILIAAAACIATAAATALVVTLLFRTPTTPASATTTPAPTVTVDVYASWACRDASTGAWLTARTAAQMSIVPELRTAAADEDSMGTPDNPLISQWCGSHQAQLIGCPPVANGRTLCRE